MLLSKFVCNREKSSHLLQVKQRGALKSAFAPGHPPSTDTHSTSPLALNKVSWLTPFHHYFVFVKGRRHLDRALQNWEPLSRRCAVGDPSGTGKSAIVALCT